MSIPNTLILLAKYMDSEYNKHITFLCIIYIVTHFLLILNQGLYWDDYTVFKIDHQSVVNNFSQSGMPFIGYYHNILSGLPHAILLYRCIVFVCYLISSLSLYSILYRLVWIDSSSRYFIAVLFTVLPLNTARITLICSPYAICLASFYFAFYILALYLEKKIWYLRQLSIILFFISFFTNSLLVFFALVPIYITYIELSSCSEKYYYKVFIKYMDYILLPLLFWFLKYWLMQTSGIFANYNKISTIHIIRSPYRLVSAIKHIVVDIVHVMSQVGLVYWLLLFVMCIIISLTTYRQTDYPPNKYLFSILILGILSLVLGFFPYLAVGLWPQVTSWGNRHLLLTPLGFSMIIVAIVQLLIRKEVFHIFMVGIIGVMVLVQIDSYLYFQQNWYTQLSIINNIRKNDVIRKNTTFRVVNKIHDDTQFTRYSFYKYTGMLKYAFKDETRFAEEVEKIVKFEEYGGIKKFINPTHSMSMYKPGPIDCFVTITTSGAINDRIATLKLMFLEYTNNKQFLYDIDKLVIVQAQPV